MCTQLSADSPLGPQVASPLRYRQPLQEEMEGGGGGAVGDGKCSRQQGGGDALQERRWE